MTNASSWSDLVAAEQIDRDAASDLCEAEDGEISSWSRRMRAGRLDGSFSIQAFARHRIATAQASDADIARLEKERDEQAGAYANVVVDLRAAEAESARLREALEPSGETKAAYIGEVRDSVAITQRNGTEKHYDHAVSWTAIKAVMAMIRTRALAGGSKQEVVDHG